MIIFIVINFALLVYFLFLRTHCYLYDSNYILQEQYLSKLYILHRSNFKLFRLLKVLVIQLLYIILHYLLFGEMDNFNTSSKKNNFFIELSEVTNTWIGG